jgi:hypothetical protein
LAHLECEWIVDIVPASLNPIQLREPTSKRGVPMGTYKQLNFEQIATAIGMHVEQIAKHKKLFEEAARWYRLDKRRPTRIAPSKMRDKLDEVAKNARRLLKSLGVKSPADVADGPSNRELLAVLILLGERSEDPVIDALGRIGRLTEIVDGVVAAAELEVRAKKAAVDVTEIGKLTTRKGNPGDDAINDWIAAMMDLYRRITGRESATSVGSPGRRNAGIAQGPFIRFLQAAGKPLNMKLFEDALRSRVRTILKGRPE